MSAGHAVDCAIGARAELRGSCSCGYVEQRWKIRLVGHLGDRGVTTNLRDKAITETAIELQLGDISHLTSVDAMMLSMVLQDLAIQAGRANVARADKDRDTRAKVRQ